MGFFSLDELDRALRWKESLLHVFAGKPEPRASQPLKAALSRSSITPRREGLLPLWAGEGDLPTPDFINRAASEALLGGETFYTWQRGIPELRQALARYYRRISPSIFRPSISMQRAPACRRLRWPCRPSPHLVTR